MNTIKHIVTVLLLLTTMVGRAQFTPEEEPENTPKQEPHIIFCWRSWEGVMHQHGDMISQQMEYVMHYQDFSDTAALLGWLNSSAAYWASNEHPNVMPMVKESDIVGVYDIVHMRRIQLKFTTEKKSLPKRVELQEEEWTETKVTIKN